ncbi:hypothetical protein HA050_11595 [Iodobacter sp. HSC-16F04]|uniref:Shufflon system plasmid conjugative transfer pilus tip adhesin PilV n=1 Tax=Iodobacter violaceini TaxID=3044271 RepID=A0ABX0L087_9NEIS|nr:prepilin-type N-terminal cleavage/methylation domain-containing protein [Iodobacter violacea]NHQ86761.1 hypothetical protein [Iodobacter violacea]
MKKIQSKQRGYLLLEMMIVMTITAIILGGFIHSSAQERKQRRVDTYAQQLKNLGNTIEGQYLTKVYALLQSGAPVPGFANPSNPSIAELKAAHYLPVDFPEKGKMGGNFVIEMTLVPAGCTPPACDVQMIVRGSEPVYHQGTTDPDPARAASAAHDGGADFGFSRLDTKNLITGTAGDWRINNPINKPGMLAFRRGYMSSGWGQFVRTDGSTPINGNQVINGNASINGNTTLTGRTDINGNTTDANGNILIRGMTKMEMDMEVQGAIKGWNTISAETLKAYKDILAGGQFNGNGGGLNNIQYANKAGEAAWANKAGDADRAAWADKAGWIDCKNVDRTDSGNACKNVPPNTTSPPSPNYTEQAISSGSIPVAGDPVYSSWTIKVGQGGGGWHWVTYSGYVTQWIFNGGGNKCTNVNGDPACNVGGLFADPGGAFSGGYFTSCQIKFNGDTNILHGGPTMNAGDSKTINGRLHYKWNIYIDTNELTLYGAGGSYNNPPYAGRSAIDYVCYGMV